ncbi:hypothetical protein ABIE51_001437 [Lysobacter sp. OAE881]
MSVGGDMRRILGHLYEAERNLRIATALANKHGYSGPIWLQLKMRRTSASTGKAVMQAMSAADRIRALWIRFGGDT